MTTVSIVPGTRYIKGGSTFKILRILNKGEIEVEDENTKQIYTELRANIINGVFEGSARFIVPETKVSKKISDFDDISMVKDNLHQIAHLKFKCIKPLLDLPSQQRTNAKIKERIAQILSDEEFDKITKGKILHVSTVRKWIYAFEKGNLDIRALIPSYNRCGNKGTPRFEKDVEDLIQQAIKTVYLNTARHNTKAVHEEALRLISKANGEKHDGSKLPDVSYNTIRRRISCINSYDSVMYRYDRIEAEKQFGVKGEGLRPTRPLQIVEVDHALLDIIVVDKDTGCPIGRPWLTFMLDKFSRYPVGFYISFNPPSFLSVMKCLGNTIVPKNLVLKAFPNVKKEWYAYGIPENLVVDNGKEFHSISLEYACHQYGIDIHFCPPMMPWFKGTIERFFRTLANDLLERLPGKTFSSLAKRGSYDSVKHATMSMETLTEALLIWLLEIYSEDVHSALEGKNPREVWLRGIEDYPPNLPTRAEDMVAFLGKVERRTVSNKGIEFLGLLYNSRELACMRNSVPISKKLVVNFKYDPDDLSRIYVYNERENKYVEVKATNQKYTRGLSLWKHEVILANIKKNKTEINMKRMLEAREKISNSVTAEKKEMSKKRKASKKVGRWDGTASDAALLESIEASNDDSAPGVSRIGTVYAGEKDQDEVNRSNIERIDRKSSGKSITIIEKLGNNTETISEDKIEDFSPKNKEARPEYIPKDISKLDMKGWSISSNSGAKAKSVKNKAEV